MRRAADPGAGRRGSPGACQAIGVSWKDVLWRQNLAPEQAALPSGLGFELAGEVLAVGAGVGDLPLGSRVASFPAHTPIIIRPMATWC